MLQNPSKYFPIHDAWRDFLFLTESLIIFLTLELVFLFLWRSIKSRRNLEDKQTDNVWGFFFLAFGLTRLFFAIGDFSILTYDERTTVISIGYLILALGSWQFIYFMERRISPRAHIHPLSTLYIILIAFLVTVFWIDQFFFQNLAILLGMPFLIMWSAYIFRIRRKVTQVGRTLFFTYSVGLFGLIGGFLFTSDSILQLTGTFIARAIGDGIFVLSMTMLGYFFTKLPAWGEFTWKSKTQAVYLFYINNGLSIFEHHFNIPPTTTPEGGQGSVLDQDLLVPGLTSIKELLEQISAVSEPPKSYKQEDAIILLEYGQWLAAAGICQEDLRAVRGLLRRFISKVERVYAQILPEWGGNLTILGRVKDIFGDLIATTRGPSDKQLIGEKFPRQQRTGIIKRVKQVIQETKEKLKPPH